LGGKTCSCPPTRCSVLRTVGRWGGKAEDGSGNLQILHTRKDLVARIIERTNKEHPDDTPQIPAIPVTDANPGYRDWLLSSTAK
jgi:periplasmic divalent cation tolerance protein